MSSNPIYEEKSGLANYLNFEVQFRQLSKNKTTWILQYIQLKQLTKNKSQELVRPESVDFYLNTV